MFREVSGKVFSVSCSGKLVVKSAVLMEGICEMFSAKGKYW